MDYHLLDELDRVFRCDDQILLFYTDYTLMRRRAEKTWQYEIISVVSQENGN